MKIFGEDLEVLQGKADQVAIRIDRRRIAIKCNLIARDQGSFVQEAMPRVAREVALPPG